MCEEFQCKARAKGKLVFTLPSRSLKWSILFSEEKEDCSQSQDHKQNLTIVSEAANFAGNMPTTALNGRRSLISSARGMMYNI